ncbi:MAG: hypothetical protein GY774_32090, partial [Planctomycetes bacterium]|nr:hypothetical protein [Planctomycetota bacterium]
MKTHKKPEPKSGSLMKWIVKRESVKSESKKKVNDMVELQPIVKTRQLKLRKAPVREPTVVANPARPRPPRAPRRSKQPAIDTSPFVAPARLTDTDLDKRSPQFRIAHVQHFNALKSDFPVLDKTMYHEVNKSCLGVSLRRFQAWFQQYEADLKKVNMPKPKKERHQNKVVCQAARARYTAKQKLELIKQFDEAKAANPSLSIKAWSDARKNLNEKTLTSWLKPRAMPNKQSPKKRPRASMD